MPKKISKPKETIIQVAKTLLEQEGYGALSIRNLAVKSGVSIGTIYNYFQDKRALDTELIIAFWSECDLRVKAICDNEQLDFYDKMSAINDVMIYFVGLFKVLFMQVVESRQYSYLPHEADKKEQLILSMTRSVEKAILLENESLLDASPNSEAIAKWIINSMMMVSHMHVMTYSELENFIKKMMR